MSNFGEPEFQTQNPLKFLAFNPAVRAHPAAAAHPHAEAAAVHAEVLMARRFTDQERGVLEKLVEAAGNPFELKTQVAQATYGEPWFEGSQSFSIVIAGDAPPYLRGRRTTGSTSIVANADVRRDGRLDDSDYIGGLILWAENGLIDAFEYNWVTDEMPDSLPPVKDVVW